MHNSPVQSGNSDRPEIVFLVSQPRAGSTLLQKLLAAHSDVVTASEPWIMLPAASVLRPGTVTADYDTDLASRALDSFLGNLPEGRATYVEGLRRMYNHLYGQALSVQRGRVFLDKTPRYYLIISQLVEIFPRSKIILLLRNPLAVLVSMVHSRRGVMPGSLEDGRLDLLSAPRILDDATRQASGQFSVVRYEELLSNPKVALQSLCKSLLLDFQDQMLQYGAEEQRRWDLGDQTKVYENNSVDQANLNKWVDSLHDPAMWRLCNDYLTQLGEELYSSLGYNWDDAQAIMMKHRPGFIRRRLTLSLDHCLERPDNIFTQIPLVRKAGKHCLNLLGMMRPPR